MKANPLFSRLDHLFFLVLFMFFLLFLPGPPAEALDIPLDLPENIATSRNVMTEALSVLQDGRLDGSAVLAKGRYLISKKGKAYTLEAEADSRVSFALGFQIAAANTTQDQVVLEPRLTDLDFSFSPPVTIVTDKGLTAKLEKVSLREDKKKVEASIDVEVTRSAASFFLKTFYAAGEKAADPISKNWQKMFVQVNLGQCRAGFKPGAALDYQGQKIVLGPGGQLNLKDLQLSADGLFTGRFEVVLRLGPQTALDLEKFTLRPEAAEIVLNGLFQRDGQNLSLTLDNPTGSTVGNHLKIKNAPLTVRTEENREIKLFLADGVFRVINFTHNSSGEAKGGQTVLQMVSSLELGRGRIPFQDGSMEFGAVLAPNLELFYDSAGDKPLLLSLQPKIDFQQVILEVMARDKGRVKMNLESLTAQGVKITGREDLDLVCPANTIKPSSLELITSNNRKISLVFGAGSNISLDNDQPLVLKIGSSGQKMKPTLGNIHLSGRFPLVETDLSGKKLPLEDVRVDLFARGHEKMAVTGTVDALIKGSTLAAQMGEPSGFGSEKLKIDEVKISIPGDLYLRLGLDTVTGPNVLNVELDKGVLINFSGPGLKGGRLHGVAHFTDIRATLDLARQSGPVAVTLKISSADTVCLYEWTKSTQPKIRRKIRTEGRTLSKPVYLNPFAVTLRLDGQIELRDNKLVLKINQWQQTDNGRICVQAGGDGPVLNSCIGVSDPNMTLTGNIRGHNFQKTLANPLKKQIDKLVGREFTVDPKH